MRCNTLHGVVRRCSMYELTKHVRPRLLQCHSRIALALLDDELANVIMICCPPCKYPIGYVLPSKYLHVHEALFTCALV